MSRKIVLLFAFLLLFSYFRVGRGIVGGFIASIEDFPYQVSILIFGEHQCGGGIIDETHILTAAHCVVGQNDVFYFDIQVLSGTNEVNIRDSRFIHNVSMILCHGGYSDSTWGKYDIAVLKLVGPIFFSPHRQPIPLGISDLPSGAEVIFAGWGSIYIEARPARFLQRLKLNILSPYSCDVRLNRRLDSHVFCADAEDNRNEGLTRGDSGGLVIYNGEAVGIAFGGLSDLRGLPAAFTRICDFLPWIRETVERF